MRISLISLSFLASASAATADRPAVGRGLAVLRGGAHDLIGSAQDKLTDSKKQFSAWWGDKSVSTASASIDPMVTKAAGLMKKRGLPACEQAVVLLRTVHEKDPDNVDVKLELADAINAVMRIKTNANTLLIDGGLDTPANKKIWKKMGDEALPLAKDAYAAKPDSIRALAVYADSFMFSCSSKGIVKQALSGAGKEYKRVAGLLRKHPSWDSAVGCALLGGFYNVAPWPVGNKDLARKILAEAAALHPKSRRNLYYVGVNAFQMGDFELAAEFFASALKAPCGSATEEDFGDFMLEEARKGMARAKAELQGNC